MSVSQADKAKRLRALHEAPGLAVPPVRLQAIGTTWFGLQVGPVESFAVGAVAPLTIEQHRALVVARARLAARPV